MAGISYKITIIGAGNVGTHLGQRLFEKGFSIEQVFSRKISKAKRLAKIVKAQAINDLNDVEGEAQVYLLAVHDDAIAMVAKALSKKISHALVVHTSGALASTILKPFFPKYGCFYPLQTFSIEKKVDFETLPICIYSPQKRNRQKLQRIAQAICPNVYKIDDHQKSILHVAAVFVNNFTNHLYRIGQEITKAEGINFDILKPLIQETADKIKTHNPKDMQTGPARRGDEVTIQKHLQLLESHPNWAKLYQLISDGIKKEF